jgi:hypothetical protein
MQTFSGEQKALLGQSSFPLHCCTERHWPGLVGDATVPKTQGNGNEQTWLNKKKQLEKKCFMKKDNWKYKREIFEKS